MRRSWNDRGPVGVGAGERTALDVDVDAVEAIRLDRDAQPVGRHRHRRGRFGLDQPGAHRQQVDVALQQIPLGHRVRAVPGDPQILDRRTLRRPDPGGPANRHREPDPSGQRAQAVVGAGQDRAQHIGAPHVGAPGAGGPTDAHQRADVVVGEPGGEQITGRVGGGVDHGDHRPAVDLATIIAPLDRCDRDALRVQLAGAEGVEEAAAPRTQHPPVLRCVRDGPGQVGGQQREPGRLDPVRREQLQHPLGGPDETTGVAAHIDDQPVLREQPQQIDDLGDEAVVVGQAEAPQPQIADLASGHLHDLGRHVVLEPTGDPLADRGVGPIRGQRGHAAASRSTDSWRHSSALNDSFLARRISDRSGCTASAEAAASVGRTGVGPSPGRMNRQGRRISISTRRRSVRIADRLHPVLDRNRQVAERAERHRVDGPGHRAVGTPTPSPRRRGLEPHRRSARRSRSAPRLRA